MNLSEYFSYAPDTGVFTWATSPHARYAVGSVAGCTHSSGYRILTVKRKNFKAHRVAWLFSYGVWPAKQLDHINGIRDDNRIVNLREATSAQNHQNRKPHADNTSGFTGVYFDKGIARWCARIRAKPERIFLGTFDSAEDASTAYIAAKAKLHTFSPVMRHA